MSVNKPVLSKTRIQDIRRAIDQALEGVVKEHGLSSIRLGAIRYDDNGFSAKLDAVFEGGEAPELVNLRMGASLFGFKPEIAGAEVDYGGARYRVTGLRRTKVVLESVKDGRQFTADAVTLARSLRRAKSELVDAEDPLPPLGGERFAAGERQAARAEALAS